MERLIVKVFAIVIVILAISGCSVKCEVQPLFYDTINSLLLGDKEQVKMSKAKK